MKKKRVFKTLAIALAVFGMTALASCTPSSPYADDPRYPIYQLAVEDGFTGTYQEWLDSIKGEDGENGQTPHIGENGNWWIGDTDTGVPATGPQGPAGSDGQDGADGQDGSQGPQGEPGEDGQDGADGQDGKDGIDGKDGTSVLNGEGAPSDDLGKDGDSYIDTNTWDFYVKVDGIWVLKGNIKGEDGQDGKDGQDGEPGKDGADGQPGQDGEDGTTPHIGDNGNWWIGDQDTGIPATGNDGQNGQDGADGQPGQDGKDGQDGEPGKDGADGQPGKDGTSMLTGEGAPSDDLGNNGDSYVDLNTWNFYVKIDGSWVLKGNIKGSDATSTPDHEGTEGLKFYPLNDTECAVAVGTAKMLKEIVVPNKYKDYTVTTIIERGFESSKVENLYLPSTIKSIDNDAFAYCSSLTSIVIPDSVTSIGSWAFEKCTSLTSIVIPDSVTSIGSHAFVSCSSLTSIVIPDSVISIGSYAFYNCSSLTIYCKATSYHSGWDYCWNPDGRPVYWGGEWEYDENGNPTVITPEDPTPSDPTEGIEEVLNKAIENTINAKNGTLNASATMSYNGQTMTQTMTFYTDGTKAAMEQNGEIQVDENVYTLGSQIMELAFAGSFKYSEINENEDGSYHIEQLTCVLSAAKAAKYIIELRNYEDINITFTNDGYEFIVSDVNLSLNGGYIDSISYTCAALSVRGSGNDDVNWEYSFYENNDAIVQYTYAFSNIGTTVVPSATTPDVEEPDVEPGNAEEMIVSAIEKTAYANNGTISYNFKSDESEQSMIVKIADQKAEAYGNIFEGYPYVGSMMFDIGMGTNHKFEGLVDKGDGHYHADSITMNLDGEKFLEFIGCSLGQGETITNNNIEYVIKNVEIHIEDGYIVSMEYDVEQAPTVGWRDDDTICSDVVLGMQKTTNGHLSYKLSDIGTTVIEGSSTPSEE